MIECFEDNLFMCVFIHYLFGLLTIEENLINIAPSVSQ